MFENTFVTMPVIEKKHLHAIREAYTNPVIGITGNLGKTTTLTMIEAILASRGKVLRHHNGSGDVRNNLRTLKKLSMEYDYALFELDYLRGKHFVDLFHLIRPNIGIVTNLGDAHLNYLDRMLKVALEKTSLLKYLEQDGIAILNKDDELSFNIAKSLNTRQIIFFGLNQHADFFATDIEQAGPLGMQFRLNKKFLLQLPIYSIQDLYNFLAAVACVSHLGFTLDEIVEILQTRFTMPPGRGRVMRIGSHYVIDESYIGTPRSLSKAARVLTTFAPYSEQLVLIVGDMADTGINVEQQHLNMGYFLSALPIDVLITVGEYAKFIGQGFNMIKTHKKLMFSVNTINEVVRVLEQNLQENSTVAVKGLGNVAMHRILSYLKKRNETS